MTNTNTSTDETIRSNVVPSEVGWQFVPQYYTFVNKQPNRLHCFYTKSSTFIHGTEGEDGKPCFGQQEIHSKITSIGFEDCKVFIHSVDAQSSANGGIIIQVIGEMSNRGEPWRKFVQTFFLAEQPNGYFVLNDIFRFLKEEAVESEEEEAEAAPVAPEPVTAPLPVPAVPEPSLAPAPPPAPVIEEPTPAQPFTSEEPEPEPEIEPVIEEPAQQYPNGHAQSEPEERELSPVPVSSALVDEKPPAPAPVEATLAPAVTESHPPSPSPAPQPAATLAPPPPPAAPQPAPAPAPAPQPAAPPAPKTWANLAAANSKKWGSAVAQESRGTSEVPAASSSMPGTGTQTPPLHHGPGARPHGQREPHPALVAAHNITTAQCFVKSVQENVSDQALRQTLITRFGPIKEVEIVRSKACAFLEFTTVDAARRAIVASLPLAQGGEGGIKVDVGEGQQMRILVETRKERGERPISRPRGGPPVNGGDRGSFRGRGGPGRGRGVANVGSMHVLKVLLAQRWMSAFYRAWLVEMVKKFNTKLRIPLFVLYRAVIHLQCARVTVFGGGT
ncbi:hypothetical protein EW146_g5915 [Bondarzewia mesenterica]|uniref:NTF2 domain-containing protein n=1 Tax=Bondarzewia mesenterica TaxID=1095465 RepID=A0A4S4LQ34_9AGAM|nr:hypothetical protein EW146_g5915 [Bondarzewia mesenterica]